jgi:glycosyltransferase involved in cell wall biosynthesis
MPKLLLITFIDFGVMKSGSSVRPQRIYEAFKDLGYDVNLLSGLQNRKLERLRRVFKKFLEIRKNLPDFCYVEPPSGPFFNFCDHLLLIYLKIKGVPIGLFYRDAYWLFADWWPVKGAKAFFLRLMHRFDLFVIKRTCKVVFFPTKSMADLFDMTHKGVLPPAGFDFVTNSHPVYRNALYVGGVTGFYGTDILLKAFEIVNETLCKDIQLTVVCREKEMKNFFDAYIDKPWLKIAHASGDEQLRIFYEQCDIALYPSRRDNYMDFCMPVKLCEYLSRGLPVVCTHCKEAANFVQTCGFGVICKDTPEDLAQKVVMLYETPMLLDELRNNAIKSLRENNLWVHRARQAAEEIMN